MVGLLAATIPHLVLLNRYAPDLVGSTDRAIQAGVDYVARLGGGFIGDRIAPLIPEMAFF